MQDKNKRALGYLGIAVVITVLMFGFGAIYDPNKSEGLVRALLTGVYFAFLMGILIFLIAAWKVWRDKK